MSGVKSNYEATVSSLLSQTGAEPPRLSGNLVTISNDVLAHFSPHPTIFWLGDPDHQAEVSDHNPDSRNVVCALDVMLSVGLKSYELVSALIGRFDLAYVIHDRRIWEAGRGWAPRAYTGDNPHTDHVHASTLHTATADSNRSHLDWDGPGFGGTLQPGSFGEGVRTLQIRLNGRGYSPALVTDGNFGAGTRKNVLAFQKVAGITEDGIVGKITWGKLWSLKLGG